jgi:radical SAM superfamily enzyme YgiQ (UPF0313 family)
MRVLLISANTERINMPTMPVGLACVAEATRLAGHEVAFLDLMFEADPLQAVGQRISALAPEVIGVSVRNIDDQDFQNPRFLIEQVRPVIDKCKALSDAPIVLGGTGYSIFPDEILSYLGADYGISGDGEVVFPALLERMRNGEDISGLPGVHARGRQNSADQEFPSDLDSLPLPGAEQWSYVDPNTPNLWVPVQGRRGCSNGCSYCSTFLIQGKKVRSRSPQLVVDGIEGIALAGFRRFYFVDNSFNIPEAYALELCRRLGRLDQKIEWRCILYPHNVGENLIRAMAEAGCVEVALGFESGSQRILNKLNKRFTPDEVREISAMLASYGIRRMGFLLLGGPGETRESVEESLAFAESLDLEFLKTTVGIRIYPGTPLAMTAVEEGVIDARDRLLEPKFYLASGLDPWIHERVKSGISHKGG